MKLIARKRMRNYIWPVGLLTSLLLLFAFQIRTPSASQLVTQMLEAGRKVQTLKFTLHKQERIKGKLETEKSVVKLQQKPFKVYLKYETPNPGMEVLFVSGQNNNEAFIRPASFPWTTLSLNPKGSTMRAGQHHTIYDVGFSQILEITDFILKKYGKQAGAMLQANGTTNWNGITCYNLTLENPNFKYQAYTLQQGENLLTLAERLKVSEYMLLELNPELDSYTDGEAGQKIKVPTDYARKISMLLDQKTSLPVQIKVYDDKGLFEQYEYRNLQVNPAIELAEFTRSYKSYKF